MRRIVDWLSEATATPPASMGATATLPASPVLTEAVPVGLLRVPSGTVTAAVWRERRETYYNGTSPVLDPEETPRGFFALADRVTGVGIGAD